MTPNLRLRQQRQLRGWSQARLAEELGTSSKVVSRWERGAVFPSPYFRERLCVVFDKNAEDLGLTPTSEQEHEPQEQEQQEQEQTKEESMPRVSAPPLQSITRSGALIAPAVMSTEIAKHGVWIDSLVTTVERLVTKRTMLAALALVLIAIAFAGGRFISTVSTPSSKQSSTAATDPQSLYQRITSTKPMIDDPLTRQTASEWMNGQTSDGGSCAFTGGKYHASALTPKHITACFALKPTFHNGAFQIHMSLQGEYAGLIFRGDPNKNIGYAFAISPTGFYALVLYLDKLGPTFLQIGSLSQSFNAGVNQDNTIGIVAKGNKIYLYVNNHYIATVTNTSYQSGQIGVFASDITTATDATFSNAQVWPL